MKEVETAVFHSISSYICISKSIPYTFYKAFWNDIHIYNIQEFYVINYALFKKMTETLLSNEDNSYIVSSWTQSQLLNEKFCNFIFEFCLILKFVAWKPEEL